MTKLTRLTYCTKPGIDGCVNTEGSEHADMGWNHWCPGCKQVHSIAVEKAFANGARWSFNGSEEAPTFEPSVKVHWTRPKSHGELAGKEYVCHYFLRDGVIDFLSDSTHELAGKKVPLPDFPDGEW